MLSRKSWGKSWREPWRVFGKKSWRVFGKEPWRQPWRESWREPWSVFGRKPWREPWRVFGREPWREPWRVFGRKSWRVFEQAIYKYLISFRVRWGFRVGLSSSALQPDSNSRVQLFNPTRSESKNVPTRLDAVSLLLMQHQRLWITMRLCKRKKEIDNVLHFRN